MKIIVVIVVIILAVLTTAIEAEYAQLLQELFVGLSLELYDYVDPAIRCGRWQIGALAPMLAWTLLAAVVPLTAIVSLMATITLADNCKRRDNGQQDSARNEFHVFIRCSEANNMHLKSQMETQRIQSVTR